MMSDDTFCVSSLTRLHIFNLQSRPVTVLAQSLDYSFLKIVEDLSYGSAISIDVSDAQYHCLILCDAQGVKKTIYLTGDSREDLPVKSDREFVMIPGVNV